MTETSSWIVWGMNLDGLIAGAATWVIIWATRYACIAGEYHIGQRFRYVFLGLGIAGVLASLLMQNLLMSAVIAIFGFACLWGIHEVVEQKERVNKGWYPRKQDIKNK